MVQQGAQRRQGGGFNAYRDPGLLAFAATLAFFVPGLVFPLFAASTRLFRGPFLLGDVHVRLLEVAVVGHCIVIDTRIVGRLCLGFCRSALRQLADGFAGKAGDFTQALAHQGPQVGARNLVDQRCCQRGHMGLAFERAWVGFFGQLLEKVICQRLGVLVNAGLEGVGAFGAHQGVRVFAFGQEQEAGATPVLQAGQRGFKCAPGCIAARLVAVKAEQHAGHHAKQTLHVFFAGGGTQGRDSIAQALLGQGDDVHIAFHHDDFVEAAIELARLEQPVQFLAFVKDRGFRGVQVLGLVVAQHPATKGDDAATAVADRKHDPVTKTVVTLAGLGVLHQQAGVDHGFLLQRVTAQVFVEVVPAWWRKAQTEVAGYFTGQASALQVVHSCFACRMAF